MSAILFIAVLVLLIIVHELGHFLVAKCFKVRVDEFGVGYPPRAFTLGKIGETTYTLNWLPFGGFVRIFGETHDTKISKGERHRAFVHKSKSVQVAVLFAGVLFNALFAWLLFSTTFMLGAPSAVDEDVAPEDARLIVSSVMSGTPAETAGFLSGDVIHSVVSADAALNEITPSAVAGFIQKNVGETLTFTVTHMGNDTPEEIALLPAHGVLKEAPGTPAVGIAMTLIAESSLPFGESLVRGLQTTVRVFKEVTIGIASFFASVFIGGANWSEITGPVGIAGLVGEASSIGLVYLLYFTAFISVNLAVINLIPIPALDGGRILFVLIEAVKGSRINPKATTILNFLGFAFLIFVMLTVTYHDIVRLF